MSGGGIQRKIDRALRLAVAVARCPGRRFRLAGAEVRIFLAGLTRDGDPRYEIQWSPAPPERFTPEQFVLFDAWRAQATRELSAELERDAADVPAAEPLAIPVF